jgi:cell division protein FtsI/penicillin-binding protein 2
MSKEDLFKNSSGKLLGDLTGKFKLSWVEGALDIDPDNQTAKNIVTPHTRTYLGTHITPKKIYLFLAILICGLALLLSRIFYLQIIKGSYYYSWAENNRLRIIPIAAERGIIYDRFNKELVQNIPNFYLSIVPQGLPNAALGKTTEEKKQILEKRAQIVQRVSELSGFTPEEIEKKLEKLGLKNKIEEINKIIEQFEDSSSGADRKMQELLETQLSLIQNLKRKDDD